MMKIEICGTSARCIRPVLLTAGRTGAQVEFLFDEVWQGLSRCAVFTDGMVTKDALLGEDNRCTIPHEVLRDVGRVLCVGVYGANEAGDVVIPTVYAACGMVRPGADPAGDESYPPTPDVGEQVLTAVTKVQRIADEMERRADEGEFNGAEGYTPQRGIDYWTDEDKREIINEVNNEADSVGDRVDALEVNMESVLQDIADLKYVPISISSFSVNPSSAEMGDVVQSVNLTYGINKKPAALYLDGVEKTNPTSGGGFQFNNLSLTADKTWTLKAVDERNKEVTKQATLKFYNNVYYGVAGQTMPAIANLTAVLTDTRKRTVTVNAAAGEYIWYFVPVRLGACTFTVGGFDGGFDLVATQDVTNSSGYTESFRIYRSSHAGLGSTTVEVK